MWSGSLVTMLSALGEHGPDTLRNLATEPKQSGFLLGVDVRRQESLSGRKTPGFASFESSQSPEIAKDAKMKKWL